MYKALKIVGITLLALIALVLLLETGRYMYPYGNPVIITRKINSYQRALKIGHPDYKRNYYHALSGSGEADYYRIDCVDQIRLVAVMEKVGTTHSSDLQLALIIQNLKIAGGMPELQTPGSEWKTYLPAQPSINLNLPAGSYYLAVFNRTGNTDRYCLTLGTQNRFAPWKLPGALYRIAKVKLALW